MYAFNRTIALARTSILLMLVVPLLASSAGCNLTSTGHNLDGKRQFQQGNYTAALQKFQQAAASNPADADAFYNMGATYHRIASQSNNTDYFGQAENLYRQCLALSPDHTDCHRGLSVLLVETNRKDEALASLQNWAKLRPNNADALVELARMYKEFGQDEVATQYLHHAVAVDQRNPRAWAGLGKVREDAGQNNEALANYSRSYQLNTMQPAVANRIAMLRQQANSSLSTANTGTRWVNPTVPAPRFQ